MASMILYVHGPAFSLPSLDPKCLATIAYMKATIPQERWTLVACMGDWTINGISIHMQLPVLEIADNNQAIDGFDNIVAYLSGQENENWDLDAALKGSENRADLVAFTSHIQHQVSLLVDLSLQASSANYTGAARPAYSPYLSFPGQYTIPAARRTAAQKRTASLGMTALDLDSADDEKQSHGSLIPERLRSFAGQHIGPGRVSDAIRRHGGTARFKLEGLVNLACGPLSQLLKTKNPIPAGNQPVYLLSQARPSSLDCLALGYLSLAFVPGLPQPWLHDLMKEHYQDLLTYQQALYSELFGNVSWIPKMAVQPKTGSILGLYQLPWTVSPQKGMIEQSTNILSSIITSSSIPALQNDESDVIRPVKALTSDDQTQISSMLFFPLSVVAIASAAVTLAVSYIPLFNEHVNCRGREDRGHIIISRPDKNDFHGLSSLGEAGQIFGDAFKYS